MFSLDLAAPFGLGIVAAFNPCGFAMLPVFISFFMGSNNDDGAGSVRLLARAMKVASVLTLGFILVFGIFGVLTGVAASAVKDNIPYIMMALGILFIPLGIAMLRGYEPKLGLPRMQKGGDSDGMISMFLFGVSYAVVSLGCTIGPFAATSSGALTTGNIGESTAVFIAYGLGMGAVITALTIASALAKKSLATNMRKLLPFVNKVSGIFLALSGVYVLLYGYFEYKILIENDLGFENPLVNVVSGAQSDMTQWINETGTTRLGVGLFILVSAAVLKALWKELAEQRRLLAAGGLGVLWIGAEFLFTGDEPPAFGQVQETSSPWHAVFDWGFADLFILPVIRTILDIPERFVNWWSTLIESIPYLFVRLGDLFQWLYSIVPGIDYEHVGTTQENPWRWAVIGEMIVLGLLVLVTRTVLQRKSSAEPKTEDAVAAANDMLAST